jgi:hypothetical protein
MSQIVFSTIDPTITSGTQLASLLVDFKDALMSGLSGTSRPPTLQVGGSWIDTSSSGFLIYKFYTGSADVSIFTVTIASGLITINAGIIGDGSVSNTEFSYLGNVTSDIQAQLDGKVSTTGNTSISGSLNLAGFTNDATASGSSAVLASVDTNNIRLTNASLVSVGGYANTTSGRRTVITNSTGNAITIKNEDTAVTATRRIITGIQLDLIIPNGGSVELIYNSSTGRHQLIGNSSKDSANLVTSINPSITPTVTLTSTDSNKVYLVNTINGACTFNLPVPAASLKYSFKDSGGSAATYPITFQRNGSEKIEGITSNFVAEASWGQWTIVCDGTNWHFVQ